MASSRLPDLREGMAFNGCPGLSPSRPPCRHCGTSGSIEALATRWMNRVPLFRERCHASELARAVIGMPEKNLRVKAGAIVKYAHAWQFESKSPP